MGYKRALQQQHADRFLSSLPGPATSTPAPSHLFDRDWWSPSGTGWGPQHDQPAPFYKGLDLLRRKGYGMMYDLQDESGERAQRIRQWLEQVQKPRQ